MTDAPGPRPSEGEDLPASISRRELLKLGGQALALALVAPLASPSEAQASPRRRERGERFSSAETLEFKIAQMLIVGFHGTDLSSANPVVADVQSRHAGGVFLFDSTTAAGAPLSNIQSPAQLKSLTARLQALSPVPLLIAVDQEGGTVARLRPQYGFPASVSQQYLGTRNHLPTTRHYAQATAATLAEHGINFNLAPVVDLNTNPANPVIGRLSRSFSARAATVTAHALEVLEAHRQKEVLCSLKHFPGHGSSTADSHLGFVDVTDTWSTTELEPYEKIIEAGKCDIVMSGHLFNSRLDATYPATLSKKTITGLLREKMGFRGVVMSDDMQMKAITDRYSLEKALELAILAGVDIISLTPNRISQPDLVSRPVAIIKRLVQNGTIPAARIDEAYLRVRRLKERVGR